MKKLLAVLGISLAILLALVGYAYFSGNLSSDDKISSGTLSYGNEADREIILPTREAIEPSDSSAALPTPVVVSEEVELAEFWEDVDNSKSRVSQCAPYPSHSETPHRLTVRPLPVSQCDPIIYRSSKDHPGDHHPPSAGEVPGRFELGVARRDGTLDQILQEVTASVQTTKRTESQSDRKD